MAITAQEICNDAAKALFDEDGVRWPEVELLGYLDDAQRTVVTWKPTAFTKNEAVPLVAGTVQSLPADGQSLVDIGGNMGGDGSTPGRAVTQIDRTVLEQFAPGWRTETPSMEARHFIYDDRDPGRFEVYPPQPNPAGYVQCVFGAVPPKLADINAQISLPDIYKVPLYYLVLARAYAKSGSANDGNRSLSYIQQAQALVTGRKVAKQELHPEQAQERTRR